MRRVETPGQADEIPLDGATSRVSIRSLNRRFWGGRLPKVRVCAVALEGHVGEWDAEVREIRIDVRHPE